MACKDRAGDALRAVFTYTEDEAEILFARDDFHEAYGPESFEDVREAAWAVHTTVLAKEPQIPALGRYRVTVHTFEEAFVMQFRESRTKGVAVVFDRDIGRNLHEFLLECEEYLS